MAVTETRRRRGLRRRSSEQEPEGLGEAVAAGALTLAIMTSIAFVGFAWESSRERSARTFATALVEKLAQDGSDAPVPRWSGRGPGAPRPRQPRRRSMLCATLADFRFAAMVAAPWRRRPRSAAVRATGAASRVIPPLARWMLRSAFVARPAASDGPSTISTSPSRPEAARGTGQAWRVSATGSSAMATRPYLRPCRPVRGFAASRCRSRGDGCGCRKPA